eukprot:3627062-Prymnesium_polylepis.2
MHVCAQHGNVVAPDFLAPSLAPNLATCPHDNLCWASQRGGKWERGGGERGGSKRRLRSRGRTT